MLTIENLTSGYGKVPALDSISVEVGEGELVTIIGSNGAGKSTLLKTVSGLIRPTAGTVTFDGRDISRSRPDQIVAAGLVHCPEGRHVFPELSVLDNLRMAAHVNRKAFDQQLDEVLTLFPRLGERRTQIGGSLSGGEQQMLAIGRTLMAGPKLVMLDEPSLGLAPIIVEQVLDVAVAIRDSGRTVLLVEQNAELALEASDRAYVLERGRVVDSGPARDLMNSPTIQKAYLAG
ncbi:MAG TPA: ABC transporter ATP-binding protein [Nocardioidaceae bacterium]|nr:ABC transporter ATP-binding protein [Nocardioidaceae bacterium]